MIEISVARLYDKRVILSDPLDFNQTEIIEDGGYGQVDFERFEAALGIDLRSVLPQSQLDKLTDDNISEIMKENGIETGFDFTTMMG